MNTLELIKNKELSKIKRIAVNWIIDNGYSVKFIRENKKIISDCKSIDEIKTISKNIYKEYNQSYISNDDGTLFFYLKEFFYIEENKNL